MTVATSQPTAPFSIASGYNVSGGWVGYDYVGGVLGTAPITTTTRFDAIKFSTTLPDGSVALSSNSATDTGSVATLSVNVPITKNNFTLVGVLRVRGTSVSGVGMRDNSDNILLWSSSGNYALRINGVTSTTSTAFPLNTVLNYVVSSTPSGIYLCVNGVNILSAAAAATSATMGATTLDIYEDMSYGGGAMDLDVAMCAVLSSGVTLANAQSLSSNPWQIFNAASQGAAGHRRGHGHRYWP